MDQKSESECIVSQTHVNDELGHVLLLDSEKPLLS